MKYILILFILISQVCFGQNIGCLVYHGEGQTCDYYNRSSWTDGRLLLNVDSMVWPSKSVIYVGDRFIEIADSVPQYPEFKPGRYTKGDTVKVTSKGSLFVAVRTFNASAIPSDNAYWDYAGAIVAAPDVEARLKAIESDVQRLKAANLLLSESIAKIEDRLDNLPGDTVKPQPEPEPDPTPGNTVSFTVPIIPFSDPDIIAPGRGAEQWHNSTARIPNPTESQPIGTENSLDVYYRFESHRLYNSNGTFNWSYFDGLVQSAINRGQKLSFGIMHFNGDGGGGVSHNGGESAYPAFLHSQISSTKAGNEFVPDWNSPAYIKFLRDENTAIRNRLLTQKYTPSSGPNAGKSVLFGDAIYVIDIRGFGNWGEWHIGGISGAWNSQPFRPTAATLKAIIDAHTQIFDKWPLGMMIAGFDGGASGVPLFHPYPEVAHYALTAKNDWGSVGARRDQVGAPDGYLRNMLEGNNLTYNGSPKFSTLFLEKWKTAPVTGEPNPGVAAITGMADLLGQINLYHHASFGNGNYPIGSQLNSSTQATIREGFKRAGYRLQIKDGSITTGTNGKITVTWQNVGITPTYENWDVVYELRSGSTVVWSGASKFKPKLFLPGSQTVTDTYTMIPTGDYTLHVKVIDPSGYRQPLPLANTGRAIDGSYKLK